MVEEKDLTIMKYIRTYETEEKFLTDKDSTSRGFRLKPTLYKYSEAGDHVHLELDDPRKHGDSTYMEITLDSDTEFSFYIGNAPDDTQTTMNCTIDWGDGTVETKTITKDNYGFKLAHNYVAGSHKIELYNVERDYSVVGDVENYTPIISPIESVERLVLGNRVVSIGDMGFAGCSSLTSVNIPESVVSIGAMGFASCSSLTSVNIPESVVSIGIYAFVGCSSLTSVIIPNSVTSIGVGAFGICSNLTHVTLPNNATISSDAFYEAGTPIIDGVRYSRDVSELTVGNYTLGGIGLLTFYLNGNSYSPDRGVKVSSCDTSKSGDLIIPSTISYNGVTYDVTNIGDNAFYNRTSLTSVHIPDGVTSIGEKAFGGCTSLTSVHIPESVTSIERNAFYKCTSLTSINIPNSVTSISNAVFNGCSSLTSVHIPESVTSIGSGAFGYCSGLTSIDIPEGVTSIGGSAFALCTSLSSIYIPEGVTSIGNSVFCGCSSLASIYIPESVTSIGGYMFEGCSSLTSINIPKGVTSIGDYMFEGCSSLTSINIPKGVTSIGMHAFDGCSSLTSINIPKGVTSIGMHAFDGCTSLKSISSFNTTAPTLSTTDSKGNPVSVFANLPTNGTLHIKPGATGYDAWLSKLPSGWTIVEDL